MARITPEQAHACIEAHHDQIVAGILRSEESIKRGEFGPTLDDLVPPETDKTEK